MTKKGLLTKSERTALEKLLQEPEFKGKVQLQHLLWLNTSKPKFKIGDCFKVTDYGCKIYGYQVVGFNAKVVRIYTWKDEDEWQYELEMDVKAGDKSTTAKHYATERELSRSIRCNDNKTVLGNSKSDSPQSIDVNIL